MKKLLNKFKSLNSFKKALAISLSAFIIAQAVFVVPLTVLAAKSASSLTSVVQEDVYVDINKDLEDMGNRYYKLTLDAESYIKSEYRTKVQEYSEDGYYVIEEDGYYLVELWGGKGADGDASGSNPGGLGGDAGYVYGYMHLKKGQTILFTVGTDGEQAEITEGGGGANEGGNHETWSFYRVGGGGGYSAVYLFDYAKSRFSLNESERLSNYIMIAGGGGGGGAGGNWLESTGNRPSGGDAGHITNSLSSHLTAEDNSGVAGTYFAGRDGLSSGTKTTYVGKGGTNVPGKMPTAATGWVGVMNPNDWTGTYSDGIDNEYYDDYDLTAGCGGMGARRGGAGGAGFCGGSGGFQTALTVATNIGGGGGGSSFIADSVQYQNLPDYVSKYLNDDNYSHVGGSCVITYLGEGLDNVDTTHMQNVKIEGSISKYFDIMNVTASNGTASYNESTGNITVSGANIAPDEAGYHQNSCQVEILLKAKDNFAGGNYVPVIDSQFKLTPINHAAIPVKVDTRTDYCNVALRGFEAIGNSYMSNDPTHTYSVSELYTDNIASIKAGLLDWSTFLASISSYSVYTSSGSSVTGSVTPKTTTTYTVQFTVTPNNANIAVVGDPVSATVYSDTATITIVEADAAGTLNGLQIDATKLLSYDNGKYVLSTNVNQKGNEVFVPDSSYTSTTTGAGTWVAPADGWYYVQAWGGNGGNSGKVACTGENGNTTVTTSGGTGGSGNYVGGYIYLKVNDVLTYNIGARGANSADNTGNQSDSYWTYRKVHYSEGGYGGSPTTVSLGDTELIIAGGGGGAGGSVLSFQQIWGPLYTAKGVGNTPSANSTVSTTRNSDTAYQGNQGKIGSGVAKSISNYSATGGTGGAAGSNYRDSRLTSGWNTTNSDVYLTEGAKAYATSLGSSKGSSLGGRVTITLLETENTQNEVEKLYGLVASGTVSKYFNIDALDLKTAFGYTSRSQVTNADGSVTVTYTKGSTTIAKVTYKLTQNADGSTSWAAYDTSYSPSAKYVAGTKEGVSGNYVTHSSSIDFVLSLSPKDEFLGGNDVPLVWYGTSGSDDTGLRVEQAGSGLWLNKKDVSDYANVEINYNFSDSNFATTDKTIICGESVDQKDLITSNNIPLANDWTSEFVTAVYPTTTTVSPRETTSYEFTQQVAPKAAAQKAIVVPSISAVEFAQKATVYVDYTVSTNLQNMTYEGPDTVSDGNGLEAVLEADGGYLLPDSITVTVGGTTLASGAYTYDSETGKLTIAESAITDNVVITASAKILTYGIYYNIEDPVTHEQTIIPETGHGGKWAAGEEVNPADLEKYAELNSGITDRIGYDFTWEWGTDDGNPVTVMPAGDLYVVGLYEPIVYTVTVHYVDGETNEKIADDYVAPYYYQDAYSIVSPNVAGYLAKQTVVSGTLDAQNIEITVEYTKTQGQLNIVYVFGDSQTEAAPTYTQDIKINDTYEIASPTFEGYTADNTVVSGTVTGEQVDNGITVYVTYNPNQYTVSFDATGGILQSGDESKTVAYNNIYGFDPTKEIGQQYYALPTPIRTGYEFLGWQNEDGDIITEDTVVTLTQNHTLTAKWQGQEFTLTVNYYYSEVGGEIAAKKYVTRVEYGKEYDIPSPYIEGYTPAPDVKGVMGAGSRIVNVVYTIDQHTITIEYIGPDGKAIKNDYVATQDYGTIYSVPSPSFNGYELDTDKNGGDLSTVTGTVGIEDINVKVYYKYINYTLTVNYQLDSEVGDGIDRTPQSFVQDGLHIGEAYSVESPYIEGYKANIKTVTGTVGSSDITVAVTYTRNSHKLTINYLYDETVKGETLAGTVASTAHTATLKYGDSYEVETPVIENYRIFDETVSGTMPDSDVTINVYYYDLDLVISVTVEWGNITFDYNEAEWDAEAHEYFIPPETDDSNYVTVKNESSIDIGADITYAANDGFETVNGYFTADGDTQPIDAPHANIAISDSVKYWLWLKGIMPDGIDYSSNTQQTTGVCTVTIGGAD